MDIKTACAKYKFFGYSIDNLWIKLILQKYQTFNFFFYFVLKYLYFITFHYENNKAIFSSNIFISYKLIFIIFENYYY